jgi:hypothetical protein
MTATAKVKPSVVSAEALLGQDRVLFKQLLKESLQEVLEAEMTEVIGASSGERLGFETLLERHPLAFADHAAEFYAGSGNDRRRALELARANVANRPTRRAIEQLDAIERQGDRHDPDAGGPRRRPSVGSPLRAAQDTPASARSR